MYVDAAVIQSAADLSQPESDVSRHTASDEADGGKSVNESGRDKHGDILSCRDKNATQCIDTNNGNHCRLSPKCIHRPA
jgi:hypothetical protein